jgi:hypothetical protein
MGLLKDLLKDLSMGLSMGLLKVVVKDLSMDLPMGLLKVVVKDLSMGLPMDLLKGLLSGLSLVGLIYNHIHVPILISKVNKYSSFNLYWYKPYKSISIFYAPSSITYPKR